MTIDRDPETITDAEREEQRDARIHTMPGEPGVYVPGCGWADRPEPWELRAEDER